MNACLRIALVAIRELLYERVFYLLLGFGFLSLGVSLLLGQLTYAEQAKLTLDFMLGGIQLSMGLFAVFMGISLFHRELALGSVALVLSKPVSRTTFLVGKFLGQVTVQVAVTAGMGLLTLLTAKLFGLQMTSAIVQTTVLMMFETTVVTAMTYFFAVNAGAITAAGATLALTAFGHFRGVELAKTAGGAETSVWRLLRTLVPDLEVFNMKALAAYGFTLPWNEMGWALLYAFFCVLAYLLLAAICFERKDIMT